MLFYLGTHETVWLERTAVPLFVSHRRLARRKSMPRALGRWALDSGGFTELSLYGTWRSTARQYAAAVRRYADEVGQMDWAAQQDWMCEPFILEKTGLTVREHQRRTIRNFHRLCDAAPEIVWLPVLQGWLLDDYLRHVDDWCAAGVYPDQLLMGLGTLCRRQAMPIADQIIQALRQRGVRLHGFGFKIGGLKKSASGLASCDSMAWSYRARRSPPLPGCAHKSCQNCLKFALRWREKVLRIVTGQLPGQMVLV